MLTIHDTTITVVRGSVLDQDVTAIVNAANTGMRGGGGVDGAIHARAGVELMQALRRTAPQGAKVGVPVLTPGFRCPQPYILHVAGPVWRGGSQNEEALLADCYRNCLQVAVDQQFESLAFCSILTGLYRFPLERAAALALQTACDFQEANPATSLKRIVFAMYGQTEFTAFSEALQAQATRMT